MTRAVWIRYALVVGVLLLAATLRFYLLGSQSLWNDEGSSYVQATRSLDAIADNAARDIHPPGYYWLLHIWLRLTGESEFALRALSAWAGVLTVALTFALGARLFGRGAGLLAAGFVALNTFSIFYSQEARMYALLAMWAVAGTYAFVRLLGALASSGADWRKLSWQNPVVRWGLMLAVCNAAGLYTQYAFPFTMLAQGIMAVAWMIAETLARRRQRETFIPVGRVFAGYVIANLLTILLYLPWLFTAYDQVTNWPNTGASIPFEQAVADILAYLGFGITLGSGTTLPVAFFLLFALVQLPDERFTRRWWPVLLPVVWVMATVGSFMALELFREANLKFLLPAQAAFALWMARGVYVLWHVQPRNTAPWAQTVPKLAASVGALSIAVTLWSGLDALYNDPAYQRDDYRGIVAQINANPRPDDAIILNAPGQQEVFNYYYTGDAAVYPIPRGYGGDDPATLAETRDIIAAHGRLYAVLWGTSERDPNNVVESTLDSEAVEADSRWFGDVRLVRYASPARFEAFTDSGTTFGESIRLVRYAINTRTVSPGDVLQVQLQWETDAPIDQRYKVFVQLLAPDGFLAAQRDAEPVGGAQPTINWSPNAIITDNHALIIPDGLPSANYTLIIGLYNLNNPTDRLAVDDADFLEIAQVTVE